MDGWARLNQSLTKKIIFLAVFKTFTHFILWFFSYMKMLKEIVVFLFVILLSANCLAFSVSTKKEELTKVQVVSEIYPPYQRLDDKGELRGWSADKVKLIFDHASIEYNVKTYPWARAYQLALIQQNTFIYSLLRTDEREALFRWIAPLCAIEFSFYRLKVRPDIKLNSISDAKNYLIAAQKGQASAEYLLSLGFESNKNLSVSYNNDNFIKMLIHGRVELIVLSLPHFQSLASINPSYADQIEAVFSMAYLNEDLYLASSLNTSTVLVEKLRNAYRTLRPKFSSTCHD
ncbi:MAG: polar amino acid transport system substrate-binding protein [Candidatus Omnitrophota bacterium]|jgi:polar amino acid transport system substrate-binding protein